jgi:4-hydroxysphinganine ceramide fatty acyl 2-hydroxylase
LVNPVRGIKLFENPILESLTQSPWYGIPLFNIPLICFLLYTAVENNYSLLQKIGIAIVGAFTWTWTEYTLHRFFFHGEDYWMDKLPHCKYVWYFHFLIHGIHHAFPQDHYRLVFPPIPGFFVLGIFGYLPIRMIVPADSLNFFYSGFLVGYIMYDMMHYFLHHSSPKEGSWW